MTNEQLADRLEDFVQEMRATHRQFATQQTQMSDRLDKLDLNGAAEHLRKFGHVLADHPDFMQRVASEESRRVKREIAISWIADIFHLHGIEKKMLWAGSVALAGLLLAFGTDLYALKPFLQGLVHSLIFGR